jgi:hypothetical protein
MKKRILPFLLSASLFCGATIPATAAGEIKVTLNGEELAFDVPPVNIDGRVLVPMRGIFEALGAEVEWDERLQSVTASKDNTSVRMLIGTRVISINHEMIALDVAPQIINDRTMVPIRAVSEAFDAEVTWDAATETVKINEREPLDPALIELSKTISIGDRFSIDVPEGFGSEEGQDLSVISSNVVHLSHMDRFMPLSIYVKEEFKISSGDIMNDVEMFLKHTYGYSDMTHTAENISADNMQAVKITPTSFPYGRNPGKCIMAALIKTADDLLIAVEINISEAFFEEKELWMPVADELLDSIRLGTKTVNRSARKVNIEGHTINLPKDYILVEEKSETTTSSNNLYYFRKIDYYKDAPSTSMDITFEENPTFFYETLSDARNITKTVDEFNEQSIMWTTYESMDFMMMETIFTVPGNDRLKVKILALAGTEEELEELKNIVKSLTFSE